VGFSPWEILCPNQDKDED